jgi:hypothetical protein
MVVKTRSQRNKYYQVERMATATETEEDEHNNSGRKRTVKILTPSFREANLRTYKVYNGYNNSSCSSANLRKIVPKSEATAADALMHLASYDSDCSQASWSQQSYDHECNRTDTDTNTYKKKNVTAIGHTCINPMHPITRYIYRIEVLNSDRTLHYKTAFILYNSTNKLYYVYSIISNYYPDSVEHSSHYEQSQGTGQRQGFSTSMFATPRHTIQMKYTSCIREHIVNYIMTMIIPTKEYDYFIQDDIIGVVSSNDSSFKDSVFSDESSYYDVDSLIYDESSPHTTDGFNAFQLIPSRNYWFDPLVQSCSNYTQDTVLSILSILSQSQ